MNDTKRSPYHHLFRILHGVLGVSMVVLIVTGVGLHAVARPGWSLLGQFQSWIPAGRLLLAHMMASIFFTLSTIISTVLFMKRFQPKRHHFKQIRWVVNYLLVAASLLTIITSFGLLYNVSAFAYEVNRLLHALAGLVLLPLALIIHTVLAVTKHAKILPLVFSPLRQARWISFIWLPVVALISVAVILQFPAKVLGNRVLTAEKLQESPDGIEALRTLEWETAEPLDVELYNGVGFSRGATTMGLRAMYDDNFLYVRAHWADPTDSTHYWPVKRTADGWQYMQTSIHDEQVYYEDKFAMVFPIGDQPLFNQFGCAISCHQGKDTDRFPYGYKASKKPIDVWHWKGSRSGSVGYIDDKYWHHADMDRKDVGRYGDSGDKVPYTKNINKEKTAPLYLPKDDSYVINNGGALKREGAVEYSEELAKNIPEGTLIPGVVVSAFEGDRGDVECTHDYSNGKHTLWIRRKLNTGSSDDAQFVPGEHIPFCTAAFDHAAKRHAYHMAVYSLYLKPPAE